MSFCWIEILDFGFLIEVLSNLDLVIFIFINPRFEVARNALLAQPELPTVGARVLYKCQVLTKTIALLDILY